MLRYKTSTAKLNKPSTSVLVLPLSKEDHSKKKKQLEYSKENSTASTKKADSKAQIAHNLASSNQVYSARYPRYPQQKRASNIVFSS